MNINTLLLLFGLVAPISNTVLPLRRRTFPSLSSVTVANTGEGNFFDTDVMLGSSTFKLLVDTGSSDTWVVRTGYQCFDKQDNANLVSQETCNYGPGATYNPLTSSTFSQLKNQSFGASYGAGIALGIVGTEDVTLGGIMVRGQTIGVADRLTIHGDGYNNGILGLGYPLLTSAHPGTSGANDTISLLTNKVIYDPVLFRMHQQGLVPAWFSMAIERLPRGQTTGNGGVLGLGELPDVKTSGPFIAVPVEVTEALPLELTGGKRTITEWTLTVEAVTWRSANGSKTAAPTNTNTTHFQAIVDSGNYFNELPQETADRVNAEFRPPSFYDVATDSYPVACDAVPPPFGVTIAGTTFYQRSADMVFQSPDGTCVSTVKRSSRLGDIALSFLGDVFLHNVVAVFDFGKNEMRFAPRADGGGFTPKGPKKPCGSLTDS
ncbi:acid protease [Xylariaceae sp. FL1651]|nr:acid protease [Xylariaceae sp. FL1651]